MSASNPPCDPAPSAPRGGDATAAAASRADALSRLLDRPLPPEELAENTHQVAQIVTRAQRATVGVLLFELADELLALPAAEVSRVTPSVPVHRIPHRTNDVLRGLCNFEGELVLCADVGRMLRLTTDAGQGAEHSPGARRMLVIGSEHERWAFEVAAVLGVERVEPTSFEPPPLTVERAMVHFTDQLIPAGPRRAALLNGARLLAGLRAALA